jgi:hypothetical protein
MSAARGGVFIPGVEEPLPPGERVLWQGRPSGRAVVRHVFHVRGLTAYFAALVGVRVLTDSSGPGGTPAPTLENVALFVACAVAVLAIVGGVSAWVARSTVYAITSRRVVLKIGMALPMTLNIPLACIASAGVREWRDGSGEIALTLDGTDRFAYFLLWPHARPWRLTRPQPALRGLESPREVGALLCSAVAAAGGDPVAVPDAPERRVGVAALTPPARLAGG